MPARKSTANCNQTRGYATMSNFWKKASPTNGRLLLSTPSLWTSMYSAVDKALQRGIASPLWMTADGSSEDMHRCFVSRNNRLDTLHTYSQSLLLRYYKIY